MTAALREALAAALPEGRLRDPSAVTPDPRRDLCRHELGTPAAWVTPRTTDEVAAVVRVARARRVPVVPAGTRTAYWRPIAWDGAIALDTTGLDAIGTPGALHEPIWCGAGARVRAIDDRLRVAGQVLPCHPDSFGDTPIGAMVATGFASGCGVGTATLDGLVAGLEVVLGTGEIARTGAAAALGHRPFLRAGLPDPTGLLFASDGALGIVTAVAVRPWPRHALARVTGAVPADGLLALVRLAARLRVPGLYETFRAVATGAPGGAYTLDVLVRSPLGGAELDARLAAFRGHADELLPELSLTVVRPPDGADAADPRWWGEPGDHWAQVGAEHFVGVDVNAPYAAAEPVLAAMRERADAAAGAGAASVRRAFYAAPDHLNLGLHVVFPRVDGGPHPAAGPWVEASVDRLADLEVVPYRWGRHWGAAMAPRLHSGYLALVDAARRALDPDGILHPGASIFAGEGPR